MIKRNRLQGDIEDFNQYIVEDMDIGDIVEIIFKKYIQVSVTCTINCGFKYYIVLGNALEPKIFFEGNSEQDRDICITDLYNYVCSLKSEYL